MSQLLATEQLQVFLTGRSTPLLGPLDLEIAGNDCLGLIGESGSGKSLTALALMGLLPPGLRATGQLRFEGKPITLLSPAHLALRGRALAWMPQDPQASLHPLRSVGVQLTESLCFLRDLNKRAAAAEALRCMLAKSFSRHIGMPAPKVGITMSRLRK